MQLRAEIVDSVEQDLISGLSELPREDELRS
jgi:hypothetical protein